MPIYAIFSSNKLRPVSQSRLTSGKEVYKKTFYSTCVLKGTIAIRKKNLPLVGKGNELNLCAEKAHISNR